MTNLKYIIAEELGLELPIVFSGILTHAHVARGWKVVSAGFCSIEKDEMGNLGWSCWGKSMSVGLWSRPQDTKILNSFLKND